MTPSKKPVDVLTTAELYAEHGRIIEAKYSGELTRDDEVRLVFVRSRLDEYECARLAPSLDMPETLLAIRDRMKWLSESRDLRDKFIVERGLWQEFCAQLPKTI